MANTASRSYDPKEYEAWYHTAHGAWIGGREFGLLMRLMQPEPGATLLDVGSGTGYFSRRFAGAGLRVTGIDPDQASIDYARDLDASVSYRKGTALDLPFKPDSFDYVTAITSLCFIECPERALAEMWRVCRKQVIVGLLNRTSLLYREKSGWGGYTGARWDSWREASRWVDGLEPAPHRIEHRTAIFVPGGGRVARFIEYLFPARMLWGGFLTIQLIKMD